MKEKPFDSFKCKLEILSPLHIGTGDDLTPFDYFVRDSEVVVYNLQRLLAEDHKFAKDLLSKSEGFGSYRDYFLSNILSPEQIENEDYYFYTLSISERVKSELRRLGERQNKANINCFIRSGNGLPYIPGSSIKGAIRTAYAYCLFKKEKGLRESLLKRLWRESKDIVDKLLFQQDSNLQAKGDVFRTLHIADTNGMPQNTSVEVSKTLSSRKLLGYVNLFEILPPSTITFFFLNLQSQLKENYAQTLGWNLLEKYPLTIERIPAYCREFYGDLIAFEKKHFINHPDQRVTRPITQFYANLEKTTLELNQCLMRIGQGGGFFGKTLAMLFVQVAGFDYANYIKKFGRRSQSRSPQRSSRIIIDSNHRYPVFGWAKVTFGVGSKEVEAAQGKTADITVTQDMLEKSRKHWRPT